jgi:hypothetical protein
MQHGALIQERRKKSLGARIVSTLGARLSCYVI